MSYQFSGPASIDQQEKGARNLVNQRIQDRESAAVLATEHDQAYQLVFIKQKFNIQESVFGKL